jgi:single-stranded DNA-binding protein
MLTAYGEIRIVTEPIIEDVKGTSVVKFRGSSSELVKSDGSTPKQYHNHYFDFVAWGSAANYIKDNCPKGTDLFVGAVPRENKWTTEDGKSRSKTFFRLQKFRVLMPIGGGTSSDTDISASPEEESPF